MFARFLLRSSNSYRALRLFSTSLKNDFKVAVLGASGGVGQPLCLLLKSSKYVDDLVLYDVAKVKGVEADLSHINTKAKTKFVCGPDNLAEGLCGTEVVVIPAGVPRKPGMSRDDLFGSNAVVVRDLIKIVAKSCPKALIAIVTNPVNSTVPIAAEVMKKEGVHDPKRIFGVTTLDCVRASTFVARAKDLNPEEVTVPVVGGHAGTTIVPLISQTKPCVKFCEEELKSLTEKIQQGGDAVVKAKDGEGSATLSTAFASARLVNSLLRGLAGECGVIECSYVASCDTDASYFSTPLQLGKCGVEKSLGLGELSCFEKKMIECAVPQIKKDIKKGEDFVKDSC